MHIRRNAVTVALIALAMSLPGCESDSPSEQMNEGPATKLAFGSVPSTLVAGTTFTITVQALRDDNSIDNSFVGLVSITKTAGPGTLSGTLMRSASAGVTTFNDLVVDMPGAYTFSSSSGNLMQAVTSPITAEPAETVTKTGTFSSQNGYTTNGTVQAIRKADGSEVLRTGMDFSVSSGAGAIGIWLTNSTGASSLNSTTTKIQLGVLTSDFSGAFEYALPGGLGVYTHVVTFCEGAQINFGNAELRDPE